ncbi:MAG: sugar-binding transcriptional regulator [Pseudomonadota bacterium]
MQTFSNARTAKLGDAARAAWLYYMARKTQDEIADIMGISRQAVQRLVSRAVSEGLVRVRIDHPIAECLDVGHQLEQAFGLDRAIIVPSDPDSDSMTLGLADEGAAEVERWLSRPEPLVIGLGTGRTLKGVVEHLPSMDCPQHRIVALAGSVAPDGSAAYYNVIFSMADRVQAPHFPLPIPVFARHSKERDLLQAQPSIRISLDLAAQADIAFVGLADIQDGAPLAEDGFLTTAKLRELRERGGVGEVCGWVFDADGVLLPSPSNQRHAGPRLPDPSQTTVVGIAMGERKRAAIRAGLRGKLFSVFMTDERTARWLVNHP